MAVEECAVRPDGCGLDPLAVPANRAGHGRERFAAEEQGDALEQIREWNGVPTRGTEKTLW